MEKQPKEKKHKSLWRHINVVQPNEDPIVFNLNEQGKLIEKLARQLPRDISVEIEKLTSNNLTKVQPPNTATTKAVSTCQPPAIQKLEAQTINQPPNSNNPQVITLSQPPVINNVKDPTETEDFQLDLEKDQLCFFDNFDNFNSYNEFSSGYDLDSDLFNDDDIIF